MNNHSKLQFKATHGEYPALSHHNLGVNLMKKSRNILLMCALTLAVTPALAAPKHPSAGDETPKDISLEETSEEASHDQEPSLISQRLARLEEHTAQLRESRLKRRSYFNIVLAGIPTSMAIHFFESIHKEAAGGATESSVSTGSTG
jgi:hypothetical protein